MLLYSVLIGIVVFVVAWVLNKTIFVNNPAKRWVAWLLTIIVFVLAEFALIVAKFAVYEQIARETGVQVTPKNPLDILGAVIMCIIFFSTLKKIPKKGKEKVSVGDVKITEVHDRVEPK